MSNVSSNDFRQGYNPGSGSMPGGSPVPPTPPVPPTMPIPPVMPTGPIPQAGPIPPQFPPSLGVPAPPAPPQAQQGTYSVSRKPIKEKIAPSIPGLLGLLILILLVVVGIWCIYEGIAAGQNSNDYYATPNYSSIVIGIVCLIVVLLFQSAFTIVQPGQTKVLQFLGSYVGTIRATGLRMTYPFTSKRQVSVKVRNFETREIKVNDSQGNPVIIAAIIVWQVHDTAQSVFQVEYYEQFVQVQSEAALRHIATIHPYDNGEEGEATLRGATDQVAAELAHEVGERIAIAGVTIVETRISSLSYAPEIASAMLQRQQAQAVLAARSKIVAGAVTMVESALDGIERSGRVHLDDNHKAAMVANLLVVLCSDAPATPVVNTGA